MDTQNDAKLGYELTDYGKLLFEFNTKQKRNVFYVSSEQRKANFKSPLFYYILAIPLVLIAWFVASIISAIQLYGDERLLRLGLALGSLLPIGFCSFIAVKTAFGSWGKLYDLKIRDAYNKKEEYIRIYEDYIVLKVDNKVSVYSHSKIKRVELHWSYYINLKFSNNTSQIFFIDIPFSVSSAEKFERIFKDKIFISKSKRHMEPVCADSLSEILIAMAFALVAIGMGIGLICMRKYANIDVPYFLGAMFITGGAMVVCGGFSFVPFVKDIIMPFVAAVMFVVIPWWLAATLHEVWGIATGLKAFTCLSPFTCVALLLSAIGMLFILSSISAICDYIRYGHKLGKK